MLPFFEIKNRGFTAQKSESPIGSQISRGSSAQRPGYRTELNKLE
jgi:hypothetical protein